MEHIEESEASLGRTLFAIGLGGYIAFLPLNWLSLGSAGGLEVRLSHMASIFLMLAFVLLRWRGSLAIFREPLVLRFVFFFACYLLVLWSSTFTGKFHGSGLALIAKQAIFLGIMFVTFELVTNAPMGERSLARLIYFSAAIGIILFSIVAFVVFSLQGKNLLVEYYKAISHGDTQMLRHGFYRTLFGAQLASDDINVSFKNGLIGAFCSIYFLLLAFSRPALASSEGRMLWFIKWFCVFACGFFVLTSISRSNMLVFMIGTCLGLVPQIRNVSAWALTIPVLLVPGAIFGLIFAADQLLEAGGELWSRFESLGGDNRFEMFSKTFDAIGRSGSWLVGAGVGSKIDFGVNELQVHNLFLASWYEAGIPALVCAFLFYCTIAYVWSQLLLRYSGEWWPFESSQVWFASMLMLPLIRMMVGGQGGNMSVNDWFTVSIVMAIYCAARQQFDVEAEEEDEEKDEEFEDENAEHDGETYVGEYGESEEEYA